MVVEFLNPLLRFGLLYPVLCERPDLLLAICPFPRTRNLFAALLFVLRVLLVIPLVDIEVRAMLLVWLETKGAMMFRFQWRAAAADHKAGVLRVQNLNMRMEKEKTVGYFTC
jgi:hypothetical protein